VSSNVPQIGSVWYDKALTYAVRVVRPPLVDTDFANFIYYECKTNIKDSGSELTYITITYNSTLSDFLERFCVSSPELDNLYLLKQLKNY
jgi:hypothetical protein